MPQGGETSHFLPADSLLVDVEVLSSFLFESKIIITSIFEIVIKNF